MYLNDLLFLLPKISFFPNLHPEMFPEYVFERGFTNSASFFTEKRGASFSQFPLLSIRFLKSIVIIMPSLEHSVRGKTIKIPAKTNAKI